MATRFYNNKSNNTKNYTRLDFFNELRDHFNNCPYNYDNNPDCNNDRILACIDYEIGVLEAKEATRASAPRKTSNPLETEFGRTIVAAITPYLETGEKWSSKALAEKMKEDGVVYDKSGKPFMTAHIGRIMKYMCEAGDLEVGVEMVKTTNKIGIETEVERTVYWKA